VGALAIGAGVLTLARSPLLATLSPNEA
jgi:hypothetical protein